MAAADPIRRVEIATRGGHTKARNDVLREARATELADHIRAVVDTLPPLTEVQRARLAALLLGARRPDDRVAA